jgi:hypothetical protein
VHLQLHYELYEKWYTFADFFPNWNFSLVFLYISLISPEGKAAMRGVEGAQRPISRDKEPKRTGVHSVRARTHAKPTSVTIFVSISWSFKLNRVDATDHLIAGHTGANIFCKIYIS